MSAGKGHGSKLPRKAEQAIAALLNFPTIEGAAASIGIAPATLRRWLQETNFRGAYQEARREIMRQTGAQLQSAAKDAVDCLVKVAKGGASEAARVSAARTILEQAFDAVDLEDLQQRLAALEEAVAQMAKQHEKKP